MLSTISWSPALSKTGEEQGIVSLNVTSQVYMTQLVWYAWEWEA
jgi:hypothetical protein